MISLVLLLSITGDFIQAKCVPKAPHPITYMTRSASANISSAVRQDCCQTTCCSDCDPALPGVETPFQGTVHQMPNTIMEEDGSAYESIRYTGRGNVEMWDGTDWEETFAFIFSAVFMDTTPYQIVQVAVHESFGISSEAEIHAARYSEVMGRVPHLFRSGIEGLHLRDCADGAWGGSGIITLCTGDGEGLIERGNCEELFVHEGSHVSLDHLAYSDPEYKCAQNKDQMFISSYARDHRFSEDVAETAVPWFASRFSAHRVPQEIIEKIENAIPNRLRYFDDHYSLEPKKCATKVSVVTDNMGEGPYQLYGPDSAVNIFGKYTLQPGLHNDHVWYLKDDNDGIKLYAAQYGRFHITPVGTPDNVNTGWAYSTDPELECSEKNGFSWMYWDPYTEQFLVAGTNLYVV